MCNSESSSSHIKESKKTQMVFILIIYFLNPIYPRYDHFNLYSYKIYEWDILWVFSFTKSSKSVCTLHLQHISIQTSRLSRAHRIGPRRCRQIPMCQPLCWVKRSRTRAWFLLSRVSLSSLGCRTNGGHLYPKIYICLQVPKLLIIRH